RSQNSRSSSADHGRLFKRVLLGMGCQSLICKLKAKLPDTVLGFLIGRLIFPPLLINIKLFDPLTLSLPPVLE
ncbi:hypothetical protein ACLUX0_10340, partial [Limosilactobacillus mucosae]